MGWWFSDAFWFYWTIAGKGARDGRRGFPTEKHGQIMPLDAIRLKRVKRLLQALRDDRLAAAEPAAAASPEPDHQAAPSEAVEEAPPLPEPDEERDSITRDDYDATMRELEVLLNDSGLSLDKIDPALSREMIAVMAEVAAAANASPQTHDTAVLSHYEAKLIDLAEKKIVAVIKKWEKKRQTIESRSKHALHNMKEVMHEYKECLEEHEKKDRQYPYRLVSPWLYWPILFLLGIFEWPMNASAFRILDLDPIETFIVSAIPSIAVPILSHIIGTKIRQWPLEPSPWKTAIVFVLMVSALVGGLYAMGMLRAQYIAWENKAPIDTESMLMLMLVNACALAVGLGLAYWSHDPDRELERIVDHKAMLQRRLDRAWNRWLNVSGEFDRLRAEAICDVEMIRDDVRASIMEYREYNNRYRRREAPPESFTAELGDRFFRPRDFGPELDKTPKSLDDMLHEIEIKFLAAPGS